VPTLGVGEQRVDLPSAAIAVPCAPIDAPSSRVSVDRGVVIGDGADFAVVTVTARDDVATCGDDPAAGRPVKLTSTRGTLEPSEGTTDAAGRFTARFTSRTPGTAAVTATVDGVALAAAELRAERPRTAGGGCGTAGAPGAAAPAALLGLAMRAVRARRRRARG
jgi:hypothetical protein